MRSDDEQQVCAVTLRCTSIQPLCSVNTLIVPARASCSQADYRLCRAGRRWAAPRIS